MQYVPMPNQMPAHVQVLCHREDYPLLMDSKGKLVFTLVDECIRTGSLKVDKDWRLVWFDTTTHPLLGYAPLGIDSPDGPSAGDFKHVFVVELNRTDKYVGRIVAGDCIATPTCTPFGDPIAPFDSLLYEVCYSTSDDEHVYGIHAHALRLLAEMGDMRYALSPRLTKNRLPIRAVKDIDQEWAAYGEDIYRYRLSGSHHEAGDFWGLVRARADELSFF